MAILKQRETQPGPAWLRLGSTKCERSKPPSVSRLHTMAQAAGNNQCILSTAGPHPPEQCYPGNRPARVRPLSLPAGPCPQTPWQAATHVKAYASPAACQNSTKCSKALDSGDSLACSDTRQLRHPACHTRRGLQQPVQALSGPSCVSTCSNAGQEDALLAVQPLCATCLAPSVSCTTPTTPQ